MGALALTLCMTPTAGATPEDGTAAPRGAAVFGVVSATPSAGVVQGMNPLALRGPALLEAIAPAAPTAARSDLARKRLIRDLNASPRRAICWVFGEDCAEAVAVARCESTLRTGARNGQYLGLFQMGVWERSLYGHGGTPLQQARAAHRYFVISGSDWSPWTCKPWW